MINKHMSNISFSIYEKGQLTEVIQADHVGLIGIHANNVKYDYDKNCELEISVSGSDKICSDENRIPVIVSLSDSNGIALRLKDFDREKVKRWSNILSEVCGLSLFKR